MFGEIDIQAASALIGSACAGVVAVGTALGYGIRWVLNYLKERAAEQQKFLEATFARFEGIADKHDVVVDRIHKECAEERKENAKLYGEAVEKTSATLNILSGSVTKLASRIDSAYPPKANRREPDSGDNS